MTCAICEKKLRAKHEILLQAGGIRYPSVEDLEKIICKLPHTDRIQLITSDDELVQIKVHYHENNLRKFFEELNFEEAMCTVPNKDFWLQITYDIMSKKEVAASVVHVVHFKTQGAFLDLIIDSLYAQIGDEPFCVHNLSIYIYDIL